MSSVLFLFFGLAILFVVTFRPRITIVKREISSNSLTYEQIKELYKKRPAMAWKMYLAKFLSSWNDNQMELIKWWKDNCRFLLSAKDGAILINVIKDGDERIRKSFERLKKMNMFMLSTRLMLNNPDDLTKKLFGEDITMLYYYNFVLSTAKDLLMSKDYFNKYKDSEVDGLTILATELIFGQNHSPEYLTSPIFSVELCKTVHNLLKENLSLTDSEINSIMKKELKMRELANK